ncbi:hypothetical protein QVD17_41409 [Tagetes erecta]|uniref:Uncharacterized protein n=1 Tax=Tagetes erecta TaxID=13708 RepID=A0AAD8JQN1_TARER|nr:hypothetical protein QVD17_41407 [Tagetes erecta]KAK1406122.1 hypothetical protein QVD17_41409 [Tagetes erecta]
MRKFAYLEVITRHDLDGNDSVNVGTIKISHDVSTTLANGKPVVALESTIISHVEAIVRENGFVPATTAILDGIPCIGLRIDELERLAKLGPTARKIARRDIVHVVSI